jgi:hypothetical protein
MIDIADLIERTRDGDTDAALELADVVEAATKAPDRRVGAALMPKRRGGEPEWLGDQRASRDGAYRDLARVEYGTVHLTPRQAKVLAKKAVRALQDAQAIEGDELWQSAIRRIRASGLEPLGERQLRRILPDE